MLKAEWSGSEWAACVLAGLSAKVNPPGLPIAFTIHDSSRTIGLFKAKRHHLFSGPLGCSEIQKSKGYFETPCLRFASDVITLSALADN